MGPTAVRVHKVELSHGRSEVADPGAPHIGVARLSKGARVRGRLID